MFLVVYKHAQMHQNTFSTTPDTKKYLFQGYVSGGLEACENASKHGFNHSRRWKISFFMAMFLVVCKHAKMHQNTFLTTPDVEKYLFLRTWFWWPENASKHIFNHSRRSKISFLEKSFWWSGSMRKCIKTRF